MGLVKKLLAFEAVTLWLSKWLRVGQVTRISDKKIISQFCRIVRDCDRNGDRLSEKDEKWPYLIR